MPAGEGTPSSKIPDRVIRGDDQAIAQSKLDEADWLFRAGESNGRAGIDIGLQVARLLMNQALGLDPLDPRLAFFNAVFDGLSRLDDGAVPALFSPSRRKRGGSPVAGQGENSVKAAAVFTARRLIPYCADEPDARKAAVALVAKMLNQKKFKSQRAKRISQRTIRDWGEVVASDPKGEMAQVIAELERPLPAPGQEGLQPSDAKRIYLTLLGDAVANARELAIL